MASMGGMFPGQQPPGSHPPTGPGGPGQPGLLTGPPGNRGANNTLVDELEASFECEQIDTTAVAYVPVIDFLYNYTNSAVSRRSSTDCTCTEPFFIFNMNIFFFYV